MTRTCATAPSLEDHSIGRPKTAAPLASVSVARSVTVSLSARLTLPGVTATVPTGAGVDVTLMRVVSAGQPVAVVTAIK